MEDIKELNEVFFELFGRLYENMEFLSDSAYKYLEEVLFKQYKVESDKISLKKKIKDDKELYELKKRSGVLVPHGILFFKNKTKKLVNELLKIEFNKNFEELKKEISESENQ